MIISENVLKRLHLYNSLVNEKKAKVMFHANLFYSPDKQTNELFCKQIAKVLVCDNNGECGECSNCLKVESETNPDVFVFGLKTRFTTADVEKIIEDQALKPMICDCKVYVINNIDTATIQAQNKLLKVLEEPNNNVFFIINATNIDAVLPTVKSRCKLRPIEPFKYEELEEVFRKDKQEISKLLFSQSGGYVGKLTELMTGGDFDKNVKLCESIVFDMKNSKQVLEYSAGLSSSKTTFVSKLSLLQALYRNIMLSLLGQSLEGIEEKTINKIIDIQDEFTTQALLEIIDRIDQSKKQFDANVNISMISDGLLMKILEVKYLCKQK